MWVTFPANTPLYRAGRTNDTWADVLQGYGSFYTSGGRYNGTHQQTVYSSPDPLVALSEFAWHAALKRCEDLGDRLALNYPLVSVGKLWRFHLNSPVELIDLTHANAAHHFGYPAHLGSNPHPDRYTHGRHVADRIRLWANPPAPRTRPEGLVAPSVRTTAPRGYDPSQVVLFVMPAPAVVPTTLQSRGVLLDSWDVELDFLTPRTRGAVSATDPRVAWNHPRYRLSGGAGAVPGYLPRPRNVAIPMAVWHDLPIQYTPH